ncbi:MAG: radical SAM protein [bacterium]|nr:radical SAM protein [bacterium]
MEKEIQIYIGKVCNNLCKFCIDDEPLKDRKFIPPSSIKRTLKEYAKKNYNVVGFFGGEVTVYPRLEDMIGYASSLGYKRINLVSNGRRYSDIGFLTRIVNAGNIRFYFSVHSHQEHLEDHLTSVKGGFREKIKGLYHLHRLQRAGLIRERIFLNLVINKLNYRSLPQIILFYFRNFGIRDFRFRCIRPLGRALHNTGLLNFRYAALLPHLRRTIRTAERSGININVDGIPYCVLSEINGYQEYVGEFKDGLGKEKQEIDLSSRSFLPRRNRERGRIKIKSCRKCIYYASCEGPWKYYIKTFGSEEFKPVREP